MTGPQFCFPARFTFDIFAAMSQLIPSRQIAFSAELASTLGLEEAILLQCLSDISSENVSEPGGGFNWCLVSQKQLAARLQFWQAEDIQRITENLRQQGVILISSAPLLESGELRYAFNEQTETSSAYSRTNNSVTAYVEEQSRSNTISPNWQPDSNTLRLLGQQGIPDYFATQQIPEFVLYWKERGESHFSWENKFYKRVIREWRSFEAKRNSSANSLFDSAPWEAAEVPATESALKASYTTQNPATKMTADWRPSEDAMEVLILQAGISGEFIEDCIPEFTLFWTEKGSSSQIWNNQFVNHVKDQWECFNHNLKSNNKPAAITQSWTPSHECYRVLELAKIDIEFAQKLIPEFIMYWLERNELRKSWNKIFVSFAKQQWHHHKNSETNPRDRSLVEDLSDRSWAN